VTLRKPRPALPVACRDGDDVIFLVLAVAARTDFLVSGDGDLSELRSSAPVPIVAVGELQSRLRPSVNT